MPHGPYSRMFYFPDENQESSIKSGLLAKRIIDKMDGDVFFEALTVIEMRIFRIFDHAKDPETRQPLDNCLKQEEGTIWRLTTCLDNLLGYKGYVVHEYDLPREVMRLKKPYVESVARQIRLYFIHEVLLTLNEEGDIWFDTGTRHWTLRQSKIDEYASRRARATKRRMKIDLRNYHGRNRGQSKRRGVPTGTSIGYCA